MTAPIEVELPVCPRCGRVGKQPRATRISFSCTGAAKTPHPRTAMVVRRFREVAAK
ncbi:MAG: hypothetical protein ACREIT_09685 [Tepidisphaeraceae bacterium]